MKLWGMGRWEKGEEEGVWGKGGVDVYKVGGCRVWVSRV